MYLTNNIKKTDQSELFNVNITQKTANTKVTTSCNINETNNTFSVGSLLKQFKIKQGKYIRRSSRGTKMLFNSLINILEKKHTSKIQKSVFVLLVSGFDYNLMSLKRSITKTFAQFFYKKSNYGVFMFNLKVSFNKNKTKKIKSIKKRLKKKILLNFLKKVM